MVKMELETINLTSGPQSFSEIDITAIGSYLTCTVLCNHSQTNLKVNVQILDSPRYTRTIRHDHELSMLCDNIGAAPRAVKRKERNTDAIIRNFDAIKRHIDAKKRYNEEKKRQNEAKQNEKPKVAIKRKKIEVKNEKQNR